MGVSRNTPSDHIYGNWGRLDGTHGAKTNAQVHNKNWDNETGKVGDNLLEGDKERSWK